MKLTRKTQLLGVLLVLSTLLGGCMSYDRNHQPTGFIYHYMVIPTQEILNHLATLFQGNYGWAIIIFSLFVRLIIMPISFKQSRNMLIQQEKMNLIKPYMDEINARSAQATTQEEKMAISQEQMELYKANNINIAGGLTGCLPLLIQIPIFNAMYNAILLSPEISASNFLGISLGKAFIPLALVAGATYFVQAWLSQQTMNEDQKKQMRSMLYMSPIMILMFTFRSPAGLGLYFLTGGLAAMLQTWIQNTYIRPRVIAEIDEEIKNKPIIVPKKTVIKKAKPQATAKNSQQTETFNRMMANNNRSNKNKQKKK